MQVRRFSEGRFSGLGEEHPQGCWIKADDFDRTLAERDALQQRLNAVEEENDRLRNQPAQQHQGEPVALPARKNPSAYPLPMDAARGYGWNACLDEIAKLGPLYAHADPGEVERLRAEIEEWNRIFDMQEGKIDAIRAQLVERDALLREVLLGLWPSTPLAIKINAALSASAEPSAPVEIDERAEFEKWWSSLTSVDPYTKGEHWEAWQARAALERKP